MFDDENDNPKVPFYTPFLEQKKDIDGSSVLYTIKAPFELVHADDVANIHIFLRSAVVPSYCLLCVDLFSSKVCLPNEKRSNLAKKRELFYEEIERKCTVMNEQMRLQTDLEFQQREIKLNEKYNVLMINTKVRDRRVFAAEQKIREFKKLLLKSKRLHKGTTSLHLETKQLIQRAVNITNKITSQKYGFSPDFVGEKH